MWTKGNVFFFIIPHLTSKTIHVRSTCVADSSASNCAGQRSMKMLLFINRLTKDHICKKVLCKQQGPVFDFWLDQRRKGILHTTLEKRCLATSPSSCKITSCKTRLWGRWTFHCWGIVVSISTSAVERTKAAGDHSKVKALKSAPSCLNCTDPQVMSYKRFHNRNLLQVANDAPSWGSITNNIKSNMAVSNHSIQIPNKPGCCIKPKQRCTVG